MYQNINVLFFDDKKFLLKGLQRHFNKQFTCHIATTLEEATEIINTHNIQILVADHQMPDEIGIKLLNTYKDNEKIRRILTTSDRHSDLVLTMLNDGMVHAIVYTPLSRDVLGEEMKSQANAIKN